MTAGASDEFVSCLMASFVTVLAWSWFAVAKSIAFCSPRSSASTVCGCSFRNCVRTISTVVGNWPPGHRLFSSTSTLAPASTSRELHGSGSQPPAT